MSFADILECTIDFEGQKLAEQLTHYLLILSGIASFIVGYSMQSMQMLLIVFSAGLALTALAVIPPWPMYNKHPQSFIAEEDVNEKKE
ncbi:microsomal signal peptidase 12kDa subunit [Parasitella parasitica]|nr:microsomal signal peptidase 12kDa subunit [Parasitella parasitica]